MAKQPTKKVVKKTAQRSTVKKAATKKTTAKKGVTKKVAARKVAAKVPVTKKAVTKKAVAKKAPAKKTAVKKTASRKAARKAPASKKPIVTTVIARVDAGFGNEIFIRGNNSGLTWDSGTLMENVGPDEWAWKSNAVTSELEFKVLLNDEIWSTGPNGVVFPGATVVFEPGF